MAWTEAIVPRAAVAAALAAFLAVGVLGVSRYLWNFWLYRGYAPPADPAYVQVHGTATTFELASPALGGRRQQVVVYLPPGYSAHPRRRYPVVYLLHGFPGRPLSWLLTVRMGVVEDALVAKRRARPMLLVMPSGSTGTFTDKEWANGYRPHEGWETFAARDVVRAVDARYRTIAKPGARVLAGLSEGGYAALNIGFHHPREFGVLESWSGYVRADDLKAIFGDSPRLLRRNSPLVQLRRVAPLLRRRHVFVWAYSGSTDRLRAQNVAFARGLRRLHVSHVFFVGRGGHDWALWRGDAARAYLAASEHVHA